MSIFPFFPAPTVKGRILGLWRARPAEQRTFLALHDFESQVWRDGLQLDSNSLQHRLAVFKLTKGLVAPD
ncbi:MAG: hypothetical protein JWQ88_3463 [Rhodoferax sp.]|nr:hypothetical protein [Rhodoferax sp.]